MISLPVAALSHTQMCIFVSHGIFLVSCVVVAQTRYRRAAGCPRGRLASHKCVTDCSGVSRERNRRPRLCRVDALPPLVSCGVMTPSLQMAALKDDVETMKETVDATNEHEVMVRCTGRYFLTDRLRSGTVERHSRARKSGAMDSVSECRLQTPLAVPIRVADRSTDGRDVGAVPAATGRQ